MLCFCDYRAVFSANLDSNDIRSICKRPARTPLRNPIPMNLVVDLVGEDIFDLCLGDSQVEAGEQLE
jgi:hypothetical protein